MNVPNVGAYIYGQLEDPRQLCHWRGLLDAYADCEIETAHEAYLSHFVYGPEMTAHFKANRYSVAGFAGPTWGRWLVFDFDRTNLEDALADARKLVGKLLERYAELEGTIPVYFSGGKGFHVYLELVHEPPPAVGFNAAARTLAEGLAAAAGVRIDSAIYDAVRPLRLPNSRHPKTGLFKRRIDADDLFRMSISAILERAKEPAGDGIPTVTGSCPQLETDWREAERRTFRKAEARADVRREAAAGDVRAPKYFLDFLRFGVDEGERRPTLFRCAAWMAEQGGTDRLIHAILEEPARDLGITPADTTRQIRCGIGHARRQRGATTDPPPGPPADPMPDPDDYETFERWAIQHEADPLPSSAINFVAEHTSEGGPA